MNRSHHTFPQKILDVLVCPSCGSSLHLRTETLACGQNHTFSLQSLTPRLLPVLYTEALQGIAADTHRGRVARTDQEFAAKWLSTLLRESVDIDRLQKPDEIARRWLGQVASLIRVGAELKMSDLDLRELLSILGARAMASGYKRAVADPAVASLLAVDYEKYEDILLRRIVQRAVKDHSDVVIIELGSGPGRVLHQYGSVISSRADAAPIYRRMGSSLYAPDSLQYRENLKQIIGIDFAYEMLSAGSRWMRNNRLTELFTSGKLVQLEASIRHMPIRLPVHRPPFVVACILFQTLGNQIGRESQTEMLQAARRLIGGNGVIVVSVFDATSFDRQGPPYYESIRSSVGGAWSVGPRSFLSRKGVYSRWFYAEELIDLFDAADMSDARVLSGHDLELYPTYDNYVALEAQRIYKRRALIGLYESGPSAFGDILISSDS